MTPPGLIECLGCWKVWYAGRRRYLQCFECQHVYRTRWHLLWAYRVESWRAWRLWPDEQPLRVALFGRVWRPSKITFCQCCIHDF